jgi:signal transduction histidine kinase
MRTLLIVGDAAARQWLCEVLARSGHEAVAVADLDAGLAALRAAVSPVVALSIESAGNGTADLCRRLREAAPPGDCRVLAVGSQGEGELQAAEALRKEQQLLRRLIDLHERDRQLMAYDIHDGFAQQLTAALYNFQAFQRLREEMPEKAASSFESGMELLSRSIDEARRLIAGLRPPILDDFGIVAAIEYLIHDCHTRGGPEVTFDYDVVFDRLAPPLESAIFRIVQEALTNVSRHSRSATATVGLSQTDGRIRVEIRDWGVGFDPAGAQEGRFGLQGIRERARLLDGRTVITTAPNQGTHITVELPLIEPPTTEEH